jgi:hypothetical protein
MFRFIKEGYLIKAITATLAFFISFQGAAQVYYSTRADYLRSKTEQNNLLSSYRNDYPDTSVTELSNYFPRNFSGNTGLPSPALLLRYGTGNLGFRFFQPPILNDIFKEEDITYFRSAGPYASLTGVAGSKQLQIFKMLFTHTYREKLNITLRFNRYTSMGYYKRQQTYTNNFYLTSNYTVRDKKAGYYLYLLNNGNKNEESGGIKDGRLSDSTLKVNKDILEPRISAANRDNRELKVMFNPWLRLNKTSDSSRRADHYLQVKSKYGSNSYRYKDDNSPVDGYYTHFYLDTMATRDSSHIKQIANELDYSLLTRDNRFGFSAGYRYEATDLWQQRGTSFYNGMIVSDFIFRTRGVPADTSHKAFVSGATFQYVLHGYNEGNLKIENKSVFVLNEKKKSSLFLTALFEKRSPDYIYSNWQSNHFKWSRHFEAQEQAQVNGGIRLRQLVTASVFYQSVSNYLYFDEKAEPAQLKGTVSNLALSLDFTKVFWRHLGVSVNYMHQVTDKTKYVRIPPQVFTGKLFYNASLFRNNLQLQIGSQLQQYETFTAYAYMPATQVFYLQHSYRAGTYPYVDVYLNGRIRPVSFFLKVENLLQGYAGTAYSFIPGYYQPDRAFRFGITWVFFD